MYKLLIVDDEPLERQALRYFIEGSELEISSISEAGNGIDAIRLALAEQPDICILDIKMPGLNGLEVMEQLRSFDRQCKVILSTAYSDFDYAIQALHLGVLDFLVKPVKKEVLLRAITKAIDELDEQHNLILRKQRITDMSYVLEKRILKELVTGQIDEETLWFLDGIGLGNDILCAGFFWRLERELSEEEKARLSLHLRKELTEAGCQHLLFVHRTSIDLLILGNSELPQEETQTAVTRIFRRALYQFQIPSRSAKGPWVNDIFQIELSYVEAKKSLSEPVLFPVVDFLSAPDNLKEDSLRDSKEPAEIREMCRYLEDHYSEKISLEDVTQKVGFSKYYGGRLFKQYMGTTIIDYLIQLRMNKAKELLLKDEYSIKQISYMIGYQDPNYFTWSFKKAMGMSPVKYRYTKHPEKQEP